ncbi:hypothetical protein [Spirulina sp. 06S082]|uniref:hypothetical protein n=1 Tax=Spirulina sp. 06S082 TaxID=3110248 RepID=UPI002B2150E2|nr:hypothetical protein [Spirulina sp. 06S082]MEA5469336.1 hypothetical protein [Spirulina sp. 06S082]
MTTPDINNEKPPEVQYEEHLYEIARFLRLKEKKDAYYTLNSQLLQVRREIERYAEEIHEEWLNSKPPFKPGDRVKVTGNGHLLKGETGWVYSLPYEDERADPQFAQEEVLVFFEDIEHPERIHCDRLTLLN